MDQTIFDPIDAYCERLGPGALGGAAERLDEPRLHCRGPDLRAAAGRTATAARPCAGGDFGRDRGRLGPVSHLRQRADRASRCAGHRGFRLRLRLRREPACARLVARLGLGLHARACPVPRARDHPLRGAAGICGVLGLLVRLRADRGLRRRPVVRKPAFARGLLDRRGHPVGLDHGPFARPEPLRGAAPWHPFRLAYPQRASCWAG
jgi:hypothetical protein